LWCTLARFPWMDLQSGSTGMPDIITKRETGGCVAWSCSCFAARRDYGSL
jgi:hypothetical protein